MQFKDEDVDPISSRRIPIRGEINILAASPTHILAEKHTNGQSKLMMCSKKKQHFENGPTVIEEIREALWEKSERKFLLLGENRVFAFDTEGKEIEILKTIQSENNKHFKSFALDETQGILLIAYNEWGTQFIDKWKKESQDNWKKIGQCPINLNDNEFIGVLKTFNDKKSSKIVMTICDTYFEEWRIEMRDVETGICLPNIKIGNWNPRSDVQMIKIEENMKDITWLIYSADENRIIAVDKEGQRTYWNYKYPVKQILHWGKENIIICTRRAIDIQLLE